MFVKKSVSPNPTNVSVENKPVEQFTALAFQGGSIRGRAYVSAVRELEANGLLNLSYIQRVIGTSAGSIMALGLALSYSVNELEDLQNQLNYEELLDDKYQTRDVLFELNDKVSGKPSFFSKTTAVTGVTASHPTATTQMTVDLKNSFGLYDGKYFLEWAENLIQRACREKSKAKQPVPHLTFGELHNWVLHNQENGTQFKDLYVVAYDVTQSVSYVLSWETDPDMLIADAVRASMSIPLIFKPYHCRKKINSLMVLADNSRLFVDGGTTGLMDNFPLRKFDYQCYFDGTLEKEISEKAKKSVRKPIYNPHTLGLCLVESEEHQAVIENTPLPKKLVNAFVPFFIQILKGFYGRQDRTAYLQEDMMRTVFIQTTGVGMLDFNLTPEKKRALDEAGIAGAKDFAQRASFASKNDSAQKDKVLGK